MTRSPPKSRALSRRAFVGGAIGATAWALSDSSRADRRAPTALFVSHGSPLFAPPDGPRILELKGWGARLASPRGILVMTPHYGVRRIELGATGRGFAMFDLPLPMKRRIPRELDYPSPPSEGLARQVEAALGRKLPRGARRGFDHTTWMPLLCLYPAAAVPVLEISYPYCVEAEAFALGQRLSPLAAEGVLFVGSGGMTHNLAAAGTALASSPTAPPWAFEFDAWAAERFAATDVDALIDFRRRAPAAELAHPDDGGHYRVSLVALGFAVGARRAGAPTFPVTGFEETLSKRCVEFG